MPGIYNDITSREIAARRKAVPTQQSVDRTVTVTMDLSKALDQLIADGRFGWVYFEVKDLFTATLEAGIQSREIHLIQYNKEIRSADALVEMERQGFRPATLLELLWIGIQHPQLQPQFEIVALDVPSRNVIVVLSREDSSSCNLCTCPRGNYLGEHFRFAAVRK
jgi:hypothetical protein